jgi:glyoxylase-like metal-dependent hydrolase (beta-lactamase superfamily II)/rhodanese-related sulfurtransferase
MIFRQVVHEDLGCASYLIGDKSAGIAAVVDPRFEIDEYLELARYFGVRIEHVFETHNHADHVSGHGRLADAAGATIHVHRLAGPRFAHEPFDHGDEFTLGNLRIKALHTPGHRPEHSCFMLTDTTRGAEPWAVLTGDSLFVGDVARPDLAVEKRAGALDLFNSLREQLLSLPDYIEVWPGHLGGSMCGGPGMDMKVSSTVGFERRHNAMLGIVDEQEFVETSVCSLGAQPPNFKSIVELNHGPLLTQALELPRLFPGQLAQRQRDGALLVDVRTDVQFAEAHVPGTISIPLHRSGFGTKLAWLAGASDQIIFIGRDDDDGRRAGSLAAAVGLAVPAARGGLLSGGMTSWSSEHGALAHTRRIVGADLFALLEEYPDMQVLDARERDEYAAGHIPGSVSMPWHDIDGIPEGLDPARSIAVVCASGQRAGTAASLLQRYGAHDPIHVAEGGVPSWARSGGTPEVGVASAVDRARAER